MTLTAARPIEDFTQAIRNAEYAHAGELFCELLRDGVPLKELVHAAIAVEAPYVQVPSHIIEREAELVGVQYDHTSLALRAALRAERYFPDDYRLLPWAQAIWYMPQGMDICGQLMGTFPGHYARQKGFEVDGEHAKDPEVYFPDAYEPVREGTLDERLRSMFKFTVDGDRVRAWQYFLGLVQDAVADPSLQPVVRHHAMFAALVDKEEAFLGQSLTSQQGHKALRTRAMFDLADWFGWENAHVVFYAGFPDLPTAPRFHTLYDFACGILKREFGPDAAALHERNQTPMTPDEVDRLHAVILEGGKFPIAAEITRLLKEGRSLQSIADAIFLAGTEYMLRLEAPKAYFLPYHAYDYCNVATAWFRAGQDARSARVLYIMAHTVWAAIEHVRAFEKAESYAFEPIAIPDETPDDAVCRQLFDAIVARDDRGATGLALTYLADGRDHAALIATLSHAAGIYEGDPHVMRDAASNVEEYEQNSHGRRDRILLLWTKYLAHAQKRTLEQNCYGTYRRYLVPGG